MTTPRKHQKQIIAWADGHAIEEKSSIGRNADWKGVNYPQWHEGSEYRVKALEIVKYMHHGYYNEDTCVEIARMLTSSVKFTFDGKSKKLLAVELVND